MDSKSRNDVNVNQETREVVSSSDGRASEEVDVTVEGGAGSSKARTFSYQELVDATDNFRRDCFVGEGGFGKVFKGRLLDTDEVALLFLIIKSC